jgi:hypothetical protein
MYVAAGAAGTPSHWDVALFKLSESRTLEWAKRFSTESSTEPYAVATATDGSTVVAGLARGESSNNSGAIAIKVDPSGKLLWSRRFTGLHPAFPRALLATGDGGVLVGGNVLKGAGFSDLLVFKLDAGGDVEWVKAYGGPRDDGVHSIQEEPGGNLLIVAGTTSFGNPGANTWLVRTTPTGEIVGDCLVDLDRPADLAAAEFAISVGDA